MTWTFWFELALEKSTWKDMPSVNETKHLYVKPGADSSSTGKFSTLDRRALLDRGSYKATPDNENDESLSRMSHSKIT